MSSELSDSLSVGRVFTDEFLQQAGIPTVERLLTAASQAQWDLARHLLGEQHEELQAMYYNYRGWEKNLLKVFVAEEGEAAASDVLQTIENEEVAPERLLDVSDARLRWSAIVEQLETDLRARDTTALAPRASAWLAHGIAVHDAMMSRVNALLSELYRRYGDQVLQDVLKKVMDPSAMDPDGRLPFKEKVEKLIFFTRVHLRPFRVFEDDEKVTFIPDPCPSGARLLLDGHYDAPRNEAKVKDASPLTYQRNDFPVYCCHEPAMEMGSILATGVPVFVVDPAEQLGIQPCKVYIYKEPADIPDHYFTRLGLQKPEDLIARSKA